MKDNIMLSDDTTTNKQTSEEPMIPAKMKITSWNVSLVVVNIPY